MKNMKKLLSALTALSFVAVAGVSTVACGPVEDSQVVMNGKVLQDLKLYNADGASLLEVTVKDAKWDVAKLANVDASQLLDKDNKAVSGDAKIFLTSVLKLTAKEDGTFDKATAAVVKLTVTEYKPTFEWNKNEAKRDFYIKGGTVSVQWADVKGGKLGSVNQLNLKANPDKGLFVDQLPELKLANFDVTKAPFLDFKIDGTVANVPQGTIDNSLLTDEDAKAKLDGLSKLAGTDGYMITITAVDAKGEKFAEGDSITLKINFGKDHQLSTGYKFTLES